jgi:cytochrome P450
VSASPYAPEVAFDPLDAAFVADPHPTYRAWRAQGPVVRLAERDTWAVIGHAQARSLLADPRVVAHRAHEPAATDVAFAHPLVRARADATQLFASFVHHRPPPDHARLRRLIAPAFSPRQVAARRMRAQELCEASVDAGLARGRMDVVGDLARPLALTVSGELLGIPAALHDELGALARDLARALEPFRPSAAARERGVLAMIALAERLRELLRDERLDGLLGSLQRAAARGEISEPEVVGHGALLLFAGHLTTQHLIGNGVLALLGAPDQWRRLCEQPELVEHAVEESLRFDPPSPVAPRRLLADVEVGRLTLRAGDPVWMLLAAANRDPAAFPAPDAFDLTRRPNPHLAFGHGAHRCVGAALARLEAQAAIGALARRVPAVRLAGEPTWERSTLRGPATLEVITR